MTEKPIKVDAATDRLVTELALVLRTTKKAVVANAVIAYADLRDRAVTHGQPDHRSPVSVRPGPAVPQAGLRGRTGESAPGDPGVGARSGSGLAPADRLSLRRGELVAVFARHGASGIRVVEPGPEDPDDAGLVLLAETALTAAGRVEYELGRAASRLLELDVHVVSTTLLRLVDEPTLTRLLAMSHPL
ncbi:hypothetical protein [Agromyces sp. SYSU T0242]|uniref:hypothetical protein n=1 Tax=Agromyces litoreus TaxID=3158561 RepID=UPI003396473C